MSTRGTRTHSGQDCQSYAVTTRGTRTLATRLSMRVRHCSTRRCQESIVMRSDTIRCPQTTEGIYHQPFMVLQRRVNGRRFYLNRCQHALELCSPERRSKVLVHPSTALRTPIHGAVHDTHSICRSTALCMPIHARFSIYACIKGEPVFGLAIQALYCAHTF